MSHDGIAGCYARAGFSNANFCARRDRSIAPFVFETRTRASAAADRGDFVNGRKREISKMRNFEN